MPKTCKEGHRTERQQRKGIESDEVRTGGHELVGPGKETALCPHPRTSLLLCPSPPSRLQGAVLLPTAGRSN
ncbi:MAG: hypothetical protein ACPIOQ_78125, partial [Promethearchaeia archaeon]